MADSLRPNDQLSVADQRQMFQIRIQSSPLPSNRGDTSNCGEILENFHILICNVLSLEEESSIKDLMNGDINTMKNLLLKWNQSMKKL